MKNISWSQLNSIVAIVISTAVLLGILGSVLYQTPAETSGMPDVTEMNDAWIIRTEGDYDSAVDLPCNLEVSKGEPVSISHFLPEQISGDYGIAFRSVYNQVQVKVGDTILYQYGVDEVRPWNRSPVPHWNYVPIDVQYAGQLLTITQISEYGSYSGLFPEVFEGSKSALIYQQWRQSGVATIGMILLLLLTIGVVAIAAGQRLLEKQEMRLRYYVILLVLVGLWSISGNPVITDMTAHGYSWWLVHILTRMLIPIVYLLFLRGYMQRRRMTMLVDGGMLITALAYVTAVILQLLGLVEFSQSYEVLGGLYRIGFLLYTVIMAIGWLRYQQKELRAITIVQSLLVAAGGIDLFVRPNHLYQQESTFWQMAVVVYMFLLIWLVIRLIMEQIRQQVIQAEEGYEGQRAQAVAMMNPNFLFAALNSLLNITKREAPHTAKFIFAFSKYLRYNFDSVRKEQLIPFAQELEHIVAYLELQRMRMPGLQIEIEDKLHDFFVPSRSIEAIVENAAKYGIGKNGNQGRIIVRSYERRDSYAIQIVDEGAGFDTDMLYHKDTPTSMKTVRQRLEASVGGVIEVNSRYGVGTIVTVKVPKKQQSNRNLVEG